MRARVCACAFVAIHPRHWEERLTDYRLRKKEKGKKKWIKGSEATAPHVVHANSGITRRAPYAAEQLLLSAPAPSATCAFFASSASSRISAGSLSRPRATWSIRRGPRKVVEPGRRARVTAACASVSMRSLLVVVWLLMLPVAAGRLRR